MMPKTTPRAASPKRPRQTMRIAHRFTQRADGPCDRRQGVAAWHVSPNGPRDGDVRHGRAASPVVGSSIFSGATVTPDRDGVARATDRLASRVAPVIYTNADQRSASRRLLSAKVRAQATVHRGTGVQSSYRGVTPRRHFGLISVYFLVGECRVNRLSYSKLDEMFPRGTWRHTPCFYEKQTRDRRAAISGLSCRRVEYPSYRGNEQWLTSR